jgi:hypothetical protein
MPNATPVASNARGMARAQIRKPGHPDDQQQTAGQRCRGHLVRQPDVAAVHPEQDHEDQDHAQQAEQAEIVLEKRGQLCQREDKDEVEEELERRDAQLLGFVLGCEFTGLRGGGHLNDQLCPFDAHLEFGHIRELG